MTDNLIMMAIGQYCTLFAHSTITLDLLTVTGFFKMLPVLMYLLLLGVVPEGNAAQGR